MPNQPYQLAGRLATGTRLLLRGPDEAAVLAFTHAGAIRLLHVPHGVHLSADRRTEYATELWTGPMEVDVAKLRRAIEDGPLTEHVATMARCRRGPAPGFADTAFFLLREHCRVEEAAYRRTRATPIPPRRRPQTLAALYRALFHAPDADGPTVDGASGYERLWEHCARNGLPVAYGDIDDRNLPKFGGEKPPLYWLAPSPILSWDENALLRRRPDGALVFARRKPAA